MPQIAKRSIPGVLLEIGAWLSLIAAFVIGQIAGQTDYDALLAEAFPGETLQLADDLDERLPIVYYRLSADGEPLDTRDADAIVIAEGQGYGGPFIVAVTAGRQAEQGGRLRELVLLDHKESPAWVERLQRQHFFRQFGGKPVTDNFILNDDIDSVSGATISAEGLTRAVEQAIHLGAVQHLGLPVTWQQEPQSWPLGIEEYGLILLILAVFYMSYRKDRLSRYIKVALPFVVLAFVGYYINASISLGTLSGVLLGYIPTFAQQPVWWLLMITVIGSLIVLGRNMYCNKLCPYHMIEIVLQKISFIRLRIPSHVTRKSRAMVMFLSWIALMLIFLSRHPALGSYEPFSMAFSLEGMGIQWYILPLSLIGALFIPGFWCRLFCPVGLYLNEMVRLRRKLSDRIKGKRISKAIPVSVESSAESGRPASKKGQDNG